MAKLNSTKNKKKGYLNSMDDSQFYTMVITGFLIVLLIIYYTQNHNESFINYNNYNNQYFSLQDKDLKILNHNYQPLDITNQKNKIHYLYLTGGFDSSFRLCEMLINENKIVQPIYVSLVLDNDCVTEETCDKLWLRRNRKEEKKAMTKIFNKLKERYPKVKKLLLPLKEINQPITDNQFNLEFEKLFYSNNLWPKKRKKHQYLFLAKYAFYHKKHIDIGVLGIHHKSKFAKFLKKNLVKIYNGPHLNYEINDKSHPIGYLNFPLYGRSKEDLLEKAKKHNYHDILTLTWSCWFPKNGKPCQVCPMCKERIVTHPIEN